MKKKFTKPKLSWTIPYCGISHLNGLNKRYRITLVEFGSGKPGRGYVYLVDNEVAAFTEIKETVGKLVNCRRAALRWVKEMGLT